MAHPLAANQSREAQDQTGSFDPDDPEPSGELNPAGPDNDAAHPRVKARRSVLDCAGPPALSHVPRPTKAPEAWSTPKRCCAANPTRPLFPPQPLRRIPHRTPSPPLHPAFYRPFHPRQHEAAQPFPTRPRPLKHALNPCRRPGKNHPSAPESPLNIPTSSLPNRFMVFIVY